LSFAYCITFAHVIIFKEIYKYMYVKRELQSSYSSFHANTVFLVFSDLYTVLEQEFLVIISYY